MYGLRNASCMMVVHIALALYESYLSFEVLKDVASLRVEDTHGLGKVVPLHHRAF